MDLLRQNVTKHVDLNDEEWLTFHQYFKPKQVKKRAFILKEGEICKFEAFVKKGCFRLYHIDQKGTEHVLYIAVEDWWVGDIDSFTNQVPAKLFIEALEDSEILMISHEDKELLYNTLPKVDRLFRIMSQKRVVALQRRIISGLSQSAEERYVDYITNNAGIVKRVTNRQIAAYLGISQEFLSKIRKKIQQKDNTQTENWLN